MSVKSAAAGDDYKKPFERSMAQLGWSYVKERVPQLLDHVIGFQLAERADDKNERAVGLFAFQVGKLKLAIPIIYNNGEIEGDQLLWVQNSNNVVPAKEKWVNYLLSKQARDIGDAVGGSRSHFHPSQPDIRALNFPRLVKYSADSGTFLPIPVRLNTRDIADWAKPFVKAARELFKMTAPKRTMTERLCASSEELFKRADDLYNTYPGYARILDRIGGPALLVKAGEILVKHIDPQLTKTASIVDPITGETSELVIGPYEEVNPFAPEPSPAPLRKEAKLYAYESMSIAENLDASTWPENDRKSLLNQGYVIKDNRDDKDKNIVVQPDFEYSNPTSTNLYDVLDSSGKFVRCLVVVGGIIGNTSCPHAVVWPVDKSKRPCVSQTRKLIATKEGTIKELQEFIDKQPKASEAARDGAEMVFLANDRGVIHVTGLYHASSENTEHRSFSGYFDTNPIQGESRTIRPYVQQPMSLRSISPQFDLVVSSTEGQSRGIKVKNGVVILPPVTRVLVSADHSPREIGKDNPPMDRFEPGTEDHLLEERTIKKAMSMFRCWQRNDGRYVIKSAGWEKAYSKRDAHWALVKGAGLAVDVAEDILTKAAVATAQERSWRVKSADQPMPPLNFGAAAPAFPDPPAYNEQNILGSSYMVQPNNTQIIPQPSLGAGATDPLMYDSLRTSGYPALPGGVAGGGLGELGMQAGDEETIDTASVLSLVRGVNRDNLSNSLLPAVMDCMDEVGKALIKLYYDPSVYEDRYGAKDLPELKSGLENSFNQLGDLGIFLSEKTTEPFGFSNKGLSLDQISG